MKICSLSSLALLLLMPLQTKAQSPVTMKEAFSPGTQYHVSVRVELAGQLTLPAEKDKPALPPVKVVGTGMAEYDERILAPLPGPPVEPRAFRLYRQIDMRRTIGDKIQDANIRPPVRRLVILRRGHREVPFSPDGPLTWGEIDLVRTEIYFPALAGLLPDKPVKVGDTWKASTGAVEELTDLDVIRDGTLDCRFEEMTTIAKRPAARIQFRGTISGVNEDGPTRHLLDGTVLFDLESSAISYVTLNGTQELLDPAGKSAGKIEGKCTLARKPLSGPADFTDAALRGIALEPSIENTMLLYDEPEHGIRFLYPRRWKVTGVRGRQVTLEDGGGNVGLMLTRDELGAVPSAAKYLEESANVLATQKAKVLKTDPPLKLEGADNLERGGFDILSDKGAEIRMDYFVLRRDLAGATISAWIPSKETAASRPEIERIIRSIKLSKPVEMPTPVPGPDKK